MEVNETLAKFHGKEFCLQLPQHWDYQSSSTALVLFFTRFHFWIRHHTNTIVCYTSTIAVFCNSNFKYPILFYNLDKYKMYSLICVSECQVQRVLLFFLINTNIKRQMVIYTVD